MNEWLQSLQSGDQVVVRSGYGNRLSIGIVERITTTQIILKSGTRFRRNRGSAVGDYDQWTRPNLEEPKPELVEQIQRNVLIDNLQRVQWEKHGLETLREIWAKAKNGQHSAT